MGYTRKTCWLKTSLILLISFIACVNVKAQQGDKITVTGSVIDQIGPIAGANIIVKGTADGTITDYNGNFRLVAPKNSTLVISFIGYKAQEVMATTKPLTIKLQDDTELLDEVVVIGYGSMKKEDLTGSVTSVKADEINRGAVTNPQELIQGKVSGVFVQPPSGQPGGASKLRIRSGASLNASNDPLIVVDGVPLANDGAPGMADALGSINPNDIETFTVLKDASATAIYGSRASNGVIMITTKKGGKDKIKVAYNGTFSINDPYKKVKTLSANQFREVATTAFKNTPANEEIINDYLNIFPDQSTNWQDKIFRTAFGTDNNLSLSGTTFNTPYRVSLGYNNEAGTLKRSKYERYTLDMSVNPKFFDDHLSVNINLKGVINDNDFVDAGVVGGAAFFDPTKPVYNESGAYNGYWNWTKPSSPNGDGDVNGEVGVNPVQLLYDQFDNGKTKRSIGNIQFDYKLHPLPELRFNLNLGYDVARGKGDKGPHVGSYMAEKDDLFKGVGRRSHWNNFRRNQLLEFYTSFEKDLDAIQSRINAMMGYSYQHFYYEDYTKNYSPVVAGYPVKQDDAWVLNDAETEYIQEGSYAHPSENYLVSFYGRLNYVFKNRYLLTGTVRRDGSSRFHKDNRWGTFSSVAAAWTITEEAFMKNQDILSNLKLRIGYGATGQQDLGSDFYPYYAAYQESTNQESMYLGEYLLKPGKFNKDLKWETTDTYNLGLDFGFLNNRINGSLEYYKKKTKDLLGVVNVPAGTNFTNRLITNIGKMENKGVEFNLNAVAIQTKDFNWDLGFNLTWNKSKITKLVQGDNASYPGIEVGGGGRGTGSNVQKHMVGYAPFTFNVYQQVYDEKGHPIEGAFVDRNGDGEITDADRYLTKSPMPKVYLGFNSSFSYKNWDLGFNLRANIGNYAFNDVAATNYSLANVYGGQGFLTNIHETALKTGFTQPISSTQSKSDYFLENASFLKMDNITLGYRFNEFFGTKLSGRLSFSMQNVFTITNYSGLDPENNGVDGNIWPRPRTYTFGVNLNF